MTFCSSSSRSLNASAMAPCNKLISTARSAPGSADSNVSSSFSVLPDVRAGAAAGAGAPGVLALRRPPLRWLNLASPPPIFDEKPRGVSVETASDCFAAVRTLRSFATVISKILASSSSVGSRPLSWMKSRWARVALARSWCTCIGSLINLDWKATARRTACWIHQQAYVENLQPRAGSYFVAARINPKEPSWTKSERPMPRPA
mmetsp:Transcript_3619/g.10322  ORF Transcript_3619/g.10322 Transcript_3619/m.10322 type:complete len:204 (-) Transcript_3619:780-1391(-)